MDHGNAESEIDICSGSWRQCPWLIAADLCWRELGPAKMRLSRETVVQFHTAKVDSLKNPEV